MSEQRQIQRTLWLMSLILAIALLDQWVKHLVQQGIGPAAATHRIEVLGRLVALDYLQNRGAAFGMFPNATLVLAAVAAMALCIGVVVIWRTVLHQPGVAIGTSLIVAGALGNLIDRVARGYVIDYIAIGRFWTFNLADSAVTVGAVLVFWFLWRAEEHAPSPGQDNTR